MHEQLLQLNQYRNIISPYDKFEEQNTEEKVEHGWDSISPQTNGLGDRNGDFV